MQSQWVQLIGLFLQIEILRSQGPTDLFPDKGTSRRFGTGRGENIFHFRRSRNLHDSNKSLEKVIIFFGMW